MPSQFFGLNIAYKGLLASNAALNTTYNNISNEQTDGYSRQKVVQQASSAIRVYQTYGCAGAGVDTVAVERVRDEFYDRKYWNANTSLGEYNMKQYYMAQLETYFADSSTVPGFNTIFSQFAVNGLQAVLKNASGTDAKTQFIGYAESLTSCFQGLAGNLEKVQKDANEEIKLKIDEINSITSEITTLNKQINVIELTGSKANELRDRRTLLLDQLSEIAAVTTEELPIVDANNPERETGAYRFIVRIAGGQVLVDGDEGKQLTCVARTNYEKVNQTDIDGLYDVYWSDGQEFHLYDNTMGGCLQGLVEMRDGNNTENFSGTVTATGTKEVTDKDGVTRTHDTVTVSVDQDHLTNLNKCNLADSGGRIKLGNQEYYYDSWSYTCSYDAGGNPSYSYTFVISDSTLNDRNLTNDRVGKTASIGTSIDYQGIPYYMQQMNEWVRTFSQKFNDILNSGYDAYGAKGNDLFAADKPSDNDQFVFDEAFRYDHQTSGTMTIDMTDDSYYRMTAKNFTVLAAMAEDCNLLATRKNASDGVEQYDLLTEINDMIHDKSKMSFRGSASGEFLQCILSDVALNASNANTFYKNYKNIVNSIDTQRISISGVDGDEEAINLVKYQNGYNLASKMVQTLTEIYDRLILETGV
ncbi:MAG: flagellar hook-associated protein FlgK [Lachnospiraceae bacterium]